MKFHEILFRVFEKVIAKIFVFEKNCWFQDGFREKFLFLGKFLQLFLSKPSAKLQIFSIDFEATSTSVSVLDTNPVSSRNWIHM
jgi:hypothetical protein